VTPAICNLIDESQTEAAGVLFLEARLCHAHILCDRRLLDRDRDRVGARVHGDMNGIDVLAKTPMPDRIGHHFGDGELHVAYPMLELEETELLDAGSRQGSRFRTRNDVDLVIGGAFVFHPYPPRTRTLAT